MIKQKFLVDFGSKLFIYFVTAVVGILVSRIAGPEVVGTVAFGYSFVTTFFFMFGLFGTSHIKLIAEGQKFEDCLKIYSTIIFITFFLFVTVVLGFYFVQKQYFSISFTEEEEIVIYLTILMIGIEGLFKIPDITFTALVQQVKINIPKLVNSIIFSAARIVVILLGYKAIALVSARLLGVLAIVPIYLYLMKGEFKMGIWRNDLFKRYLQMGLPLLVITISISVIGNYSMVILKNLSSISEVGFYTGGVGLASIFIMIGSTAGDLFFPLFSKAFAEGNLDYIKNQILKFEHFLLRFILPVMIVFSINSGTIIPFLLSDKYLPSVPIFSILIFYSFFKIWTLPFYNLMNGINKFNLNAVAHLIFILIFYVILYFMVSPDFMNLGGKGLAISFLLLEIIKLITWYTLSHQDVQFKFNSDIPKFLIFSLLFYSLSYYVFIQYINGLNYPIKFLYLVVNLISAYLLLYFFKMIKRSDVSFIFELMNIKSMKDYFNQELKRKK